MGKAEHPQGLPNLWYETKGCESPRAKEDSTMADFVYCGTHPPVDANGTQGLLVGPFNAIWCPPANLPIRPAQDDRLWLVWRPSTAATPLLLGGGRIAVTPSGQVLWTNTSLPGVRLAAQALGYRGPTNMAFLHFPAVVIPQGHPPVNVGAISKGLNLASDRQLQVLIQLLPIP
jgi:hypothetical protein